LTKILVPIDQNAASWKAVAQGIAYARDFGAEVMVLHVEETPSPSSAGRDSIFDLLNCVRWATIRHEEIRGRGPAADAILRCALDQDVDLIVMGTHREDLRFKTLPDGCGAKVVEGAPCPILVIHPYEG
jgi:nucleotide-binding universal stress UspA family protein